jgi:hypothetical protein
VKRHRLEGQDGFANFVHRFDLLLEPTRGTHRAKLTGGVDQHWNGVGVCRCNSANVADKAAVAHVCAINERAYTDYVISRGDSGTGSYAQGYIITPGCVAKERFLTDGCVPAAGGVFGQGKRTEGTVTHAGAVAAHRFIANGRVIVTGGVASERKSPNGRIVSAGSVGKERGNTVGRIVGTCSIAREGSRTVGRFIAPGGVTEKRPSTVGRVVSAAGVAKERLEAGGGVFFPCIGK